MCIAPIDLVSAHSRQRAAFAACAPSLSLFEAIVLDALVRAEEREALILADVDGVRAALGEYGARRIGRDYEVEPVAVDRGGVSHPKLMRSTLKYARKTSNNQARSHCIPPLSPRRPPLLVAYRGEWQVTGRGIQKITGQMRSCTTEKSKDRL